MTQLLVRLGVLTADGNLHVSNSIVYIFMLITAFRALFSGAIVTNSWFTWKIQDLDLPSTLPLLFSLANVGHQRMIDSKGDSK